MPANSYFRITQQPGRGAEKLLGELELAVMRVVWSRESVTVREVLDALTKERQLAYTTVMTIMNRLEDKGLLNAEKKGKAYVYRAALTRQEYEAQVAGRVVRALIDDFGGEIAISQFIKELSEKDPEQLARLALLARSAQDEKNDD